MNQAPGGAGTMNTASNESAGGRCRQTRGSGVAQCLNSEWAFIGACTLLFVIGAGVTVHGSMSMSMPSMRMPGQTWPGAAAAFLGMWLAMMAAMMMPSLVPMLWRYRRAVGAAGESRLAWLTGVVGVGYFSVWSAFGLGAFTLSVALATIGVLLPAAARAAPFALGLLLLLAGTLQFTAWKAHHLACCRRIPGHYDPVRADAGTAWRHGLRYAVHCSYCCVGVTAVLLGLGAMDLRAMTMVTVAITLERLAPAGQRIARAIGAIVIAIGLFLLVRAAGL
jgi:predicted metal-binding membrane protein